MELQVVAHCLLNPKTRVLGLAPPSFSSKPPIIQLPCPEAIYLGLNRWAVTRNQIEVPAYRRFCREILRQHADLIEILASKGARITIVGVAKSPSCGIRTTTVGYTGGRVCAQESEHIPGMGIFMEEVTSELKRRGVSFESIDAGESIQAP